MDFFKNGGLKIQAIGPNGQLIDLDSADFITGPNGETQACDCPPGACLDAEFEIFEGPTAEFFRALMDGPVDDEFDDDDDFDLDDEEAEQAEKIEAVAQLGRIAEGLTQIVSIHASLLKELIA